MNDTTKYDFVKLGQGMADTLMRAAEEQVTRAQTMMDQTKALVEIILSQMDAQAKSNEEINARFKEAGEIMLNAHRVLNGKDAPGRLGGAEKIPDRTLGGDNDLRHAAPSSDSAMLRALGGIRRGHNSPDGPAGGPHNIGDGTANVGRGAPDPARQASGLPRAVADPDRFRVNRPHTREDHRDPSHEDLTGVDGNRAS